MSNKKPLSERQNQILMFIRRYFDQHSMPPTIREIGEAVEISSTSVVNYNLTKLKEKGYLERIPEVSRGLRLTRKGLHVLGEVVAGASEALSRVVKVPLLGNIVAGEPIEVFTSDYSAYDEDDAVELSYNMLPDKKIDDLFALRVNGDSMIDAMVYDGDIVVMRREDTARNGEMVAVWLTPDDETTLKYFYHEGDMVRLQPANPDMDPIFVNPNNVRVQGKVVMVLRQTA